MKFSFLILLSVFVLGSPAGFGLEKNYRLGDIAEEEEKKKKRLKKEPEPKVVVEETEPVDPKKALMDEVIQEFYEKGRSALTNGELEKAEAFFSKALILDPSHPQSLEGKAMLEKLKAPKVVPKPIKKEVKKKPVKKQPTVSKAALFKKEISRAQNFEAQGQIEKAIKRYQVALTYRKDSAIKEKISSLQKKLSIENQKKSKEFYLEALTQSQNGDKEQALLLCKKALALDPNNLQAKRMLDRLQAMR